MTPANHDQGGVPAGRWFASTHWSVVLAAQNGEAPGASEASEQLCRTYWPPLYAFIRREGYDEAAAKDLTQEFFLRLIERDYLQRLRHRQGKFRSFLLTFLKHFLQKEREKASAQKRGGGKVPVSLDGISEHGSYLSELVDHLSPDEVYERRWAQTRSDQAIAVVDGKIYVIGGATAFGAPGLSTVEADRSGRNGLQHGERKNLRYGREGLLHELRDSGRIRSSDRQVDHTGQHCGPRMRRVPSEDGLSPRAKSTVASMPLAARWVRQSRTLAFPW